MNHTFLRRIVPLLVAAYVVLFGAVAEASHFRFGNITWSIPDPVGAPRTVRFVVTHGWAAGSESSVGLNFGDGTTFTGMGTTIGTGTDVAGTRYSILQFTTTHAYAASAGAGPFTVFFSSCCRIAGLTNGANGSFRVETRVSLAPGNTGGPVSSAPAIISLSAGAVRTYLFPVFDPDFDPVSCRFATMAETGFTPPIPAVPSGGATPTVGTRFATAGPAKVGLRVTDNDGATAETTRTIQVTPQIVTTDVTGPSLKPGRTRVRLTKGRVAVTLTCPATETTCRIGVRLRGAGPLAGKVLGSGNATLAGGRSTTLRIALSKAGKARVRRTGAIRTTVVVSATDGAGNRSVTRTAVRVAR